MFKRIILILSLIIVSACYQEETEAGSLDVLKEEISIQTQAGDKHNFTVELALTAEQIIQGLMFRTDLANDAGMLFYFPDGEQERSFWMKNTFIPLDLIFIKKNGHIHHIHRDAKPRDLTSIPSNGPVAAVLEINAGKSLELDIQPGDKVLSRFFNNKAH